MIYIFDICTSFCEASLLQQCKIIHLVTAIRRQLLVWNFTSENSPPSNIFGVRLFMISAFSVTTCLRCCSGNVLLTVKLLACLRQQMRIVYVNFLLNVSAYALQ